MGAPPGKRLSSLRRRCKEVVELITIDHATEIANDWFAESLADHIATAEYADSEP